MRVALANQRIIHCFSRALGRFYADFVRWRNSHRRRPVAAQWMENQQITSVNKPLAWTAGFVVGKRHGTAIPGNGLGAGLSKRFKEVASSLERAYPGETLLFGRAADGKFAPHGVAEPGHSFS